MIEIYEMIEGNNPQKIFCFRFDVQKYFIQRSS